MHRVYLPASPNSPTAGCGSTLGKSQNLGFHKAGKSMAFLGRHVSSIRKKCWLPFRFTPFHSQAHRFHHKPLAAAESELLGRAPDFADQKVARLACPVNNIFLIPKENKCKLLYIMVRQFPVLHL